MPDLLPKKGEALAVLAAYWFEKLERGESWREFSKSPTALALRKANRFGSSFNEMGENLQQEGLRTHYLGALESLDAREVKTLAQIGRKPFHHLAVRKVSVIRPKSAVVLGREVSDYRDLHLAPPPKLIPLEVVFRFSCPSGSSLLERVEKDPQYLASLGFAGLEVKEGQRWDFPILELFSKLESSDRPLTLSEGLAISGLSAAQLQEVLFKTAWVAGYLKESCTKAGVELADGKLEWALTESGCILVDAIGPDELRLLKNGVQLSKEFLRGFYRQTPWYQALKIAKQQANEKGVADWKRWVAEGPRPLPSEYRELATQVYLGLANELTGEKFFQGAWKLDKVVEALKGAASR
jgi:phosphoribosylaminoimidazole-succinocarboxamide synthase